MSIFLTIILFIAAIIYCIMLIFVLQRVIRFGENIPERTNQTFVFGLIAGIISLASAAAKLVFCGNGVGSLIASAFCLLFTFFLKRIVSFFEEYFDKKHQISVKSDDKIYSFSPETKENTDFFDENSRFNGSFTDYDKK